MTTLAIVDLSMDEALDRKALGEIRGGAFDWASIDHSFLLGSPVTSEFTNVATYETIAINREANVTQNTLALFGSQAVSNASVIQS